MNRHRVLGVWLVLGALFGHSYCAVAGQHPGRRCSAAALSKRDYRGHHLEVLAHRPPVIGEPVDRHAREFARLTGAVLDVHHMPFNELYEAVMLPFLTATPQYDVMFYGSLWIADFAPFLAPVPAERAGSPHMREVTRTYLDIASWNGRLVQYPIDGDRHYFKYRLSPFRNPVYARRFLEKTGRRLDVPRTWEEYEEVARFFNGWDWDGDGQVEYGAAEVASTEDMMIFSVFIDRAAPYAKHPRVPGGFYFDLETMKPLINTPGWVHALELMVRAREYLPPGGERFTLTEEIESFGGGHALFANSWDDAAVRAAERGSPIRDDLGFDVSMGAAKVWNRRTGKWERFDPPNRVPYIAWGWTAAVSAMSREKSAAFDFLCFFSNRSNHDFDLSQGRTGVNPHRKRDFDPDFYARRLGWSQRQARAYTDTLRRVDEAPHKVLDLRVPGVNLLMESMVRGIDSALRRKRSAKAALDAVASEWRDIVADIGTERVRRAYAPVVAIEDGDERDE